MQPKQYSQVNCTTTTSGYARVSTEKKKNIGAVLMIIFILNPERRWHVDISLHPPAGKTPYKRKHDELLSEARTLSRFDSVRIAA